MADTIPDFIEASVSVERPLSECTAEVRLPNGRQVFGYLAKAARKQPPIAGAQYRARLFVADFSRAELLAPASEAQEAKSI